MNRLQNMHCETLHSSIFIYLFIFFISKTQRRQPRGRSRGGCLPSRSPEDSAGEGLPTAPLLHCGLDLLLTAASEPAVGVSFLLNAPNLQFL